MHVVVLVIVIAEAREDIRASVRNVEVRMLMRVCAVLRDDLDRARYRYEVVSASADQMGLRSGERVRCAGLIAMVMMCLRKASV